MATIKLKHQAEGDKLLSVSFIGYEKSVITVGALYGGEAIEIRLQPSVFSLNEVTIRARSVIVRDDRKMILPSQEQIRTATDRTDMLRKMQLPQIMVDALSGEITMSGNRTVQLRKNGVQVTHAELASIPPSELRQTIQRRQKTD